MKPVNFKLPRWLPHQLPRWLPQKLPRWLPHKREIIDTNDYALEKNPDTQYPSIRLQDGKVVEIKEFRDEASRPWWKFFDEFEYRDSTIQSKEHKWYHWYDPDSTPEERRLLIKLDILIAFYSFLGYWVKFIDSSNLNNAYVSNMKEDLNMQGNDLINTQVCFNVGNIVFEVPMLFALPRLPLNYVVFGSEVGWSIFTIFLYAVKSVSQLQAMRFFVGCFEAAFFPSIHYILASWYKPHEISRRGALFYSGQFLGVLTSGLLQGAIFDNLDGKNGLAGWRWCFLIDGLLSFAVAIIGFFSLPGTPFDCYSLFLTDEDVLVARKRMFLNGSDTSGKSKSLFDKKDWKEAFSTWHVYLLSVIQMCGFNTNNTSSGSFTLWLKSLNKYSVGKLNNLSAAPPAVGIFYVFVVCFGADLTKKRFAFVIFSMVMNFIGNVILAVWDVTTGAKWFAFMSAYWSWSNSSVFNPMISDFFRRDNNVRSIAWMVQYIMGVQSSAWISKLIWPTVDSPKFPKGFATCAGLSMAFNLFLCLAYLLYKRDEKNDALKNGIYLYNSANGDTIPEFENLNDYKDSSHLTVEDLKRDNEVDAKEIESND